MDNGELRCAIGINVNTEDEIILPVNFHIWKDMIEAIRKVMTQL